MSQYYTYTIKPLEGREFIQRNFVRLPENAFKYSNRSVTLNERFSIIERGYILVPDLENTKREFERNVTLVPRNGTILKKQNRQKTSNNAVTKKEK
ncbi:Protein tost-1 [Dirofilaria immitis]